MTDGWIVRVIVCPECCLENNHEGEGRVTYNTAAKSYLRLSVPCRLCAALTPEQRRAFNTVRRREEWR